MIVGGSYPTSSFNIEHAFIRYPNGSKRDLGTLGGWYSYGTDINNNAQVVGYSRLADQSTGHAFIYTDGIMRDMGTLGGTNSQANRINNIGQVVGWSEINSGRHAFLYNDGVMSDLNNFLPSGSLWNLMEANDINDSGQIVGWGTNPQGYNHAFLLTPIPEPMTMSLLALGGMTLLRRRK